MDSDHLQTVTKCVACNCPYLVVNTTEGTEGVPPVKCCSIANKISEDKNTTQKKFTFNLDRAQAFGLFLTLVICATVFNDSMRGTELSGLNFVMFAVAGLMILFGGN